MLLLSAGDFYGGADVYNEPKCHFIAEFMGRMRYDAVALGEKELSFGLDKIVEDDERFGLNVLCANLFRKVRPHDGSEPVVTDETVFPAYRIVKRGGIEVGVIGLLSPHTRGRRLSPGDPADLEAVTYVLKDPYPVAVRIIPEVKGKCDVLVLLAHMDRPELERILASTKGVDLCILGHTSRPSVTGEPMQMSGVPVYMASNQGQYLGRLVLDVDSRKEVTGSSNQIILLDSSIPDEPAVADFVARFEVDNRRLQKELFVKQQLKEHRASGRADDVYLGVGVCQRCHAEAFDVYVDTRHGRAYRTLAARFNHLDSSCLPCHSTGYEKPGGFKGFRAIGGQVDLVDVQCEACHGPGASHSRDGRYVETARGSCRSCHTPEQDPTFDFEEAWERIAH